jgi:hypothetical protein
MFQKEHFSAIWRSCWSAAVIEIVVFLPLRLQLQGCLVMAVCVAAAVIFVRWRPTLWLVTVVLAGFLVVAVQKRRIVASSYLAHTQLQTRYLVSLHFGLFPLVMLDH